MQLVDRIGRLQRIARMAILHPISVTPLIRQVPDDGRSSRRRLPAEGEWVAFLPLVMAIPRNDKVLVDCPVPNPGYEPLPDSRTVVAYGQWVIILVPGIEIADDRYHCRIRRPDREVGPLDPVDGHQVRTELLVELEMVPFLKEIDIMVREQTYGMEHGVILF